MKNFFLTIVLAAIMSGSAFAGGNANNNGPTFNRGGGDATAGAAAGAVAGANAGANAGASASNFNAVGVGVKSTNVNSLGVSNRNANVGINGQSQASHNTNLIGGSSQALENSNDLSNRNYVEGQRQSQGNVQALQYNESDGVHYSGEYKVRQAPAIAAPSIPPSAGCQKPITGGLSGTLGGVTFGTTYLDETCVMYEDIRFGLEGDEKSRRMANMVIRARLQGHLDDVREEEVARVEELKSATAEGTGLVSVFELTDY